jgi:hypothetical protein
MIDKQKFIELKAKYNVNEEDKNKRMRYLEFAEKVFW